MGIFDIVYKRLMSLIDIESDCPTKQLEVHVPEQEDTLWCWAAVAVGIAHFYGDTAAQQHTIASGVLGLPCLPNGANPNCHRGAFLEDALCVRHNFDKLEIPLKFALIQKAICSGRPLCARMGAGETGHFVVIHGFDEEEEVYVADPEITCWIGPYKEFKKNYRDTYEWTDAYATKPAAVKGSTPCP